jgi:hypothetical protein
LYLVIVLGIDGSNSRLFSPCDPQKEWCPAWTTEVPTSSDSRHHWIGKNSQLLVLRLESTNVTR